MPTSGSDSLQGETVSEAPATSYPSSQTALLVIDPYNDFLSEGGKMWPYLKEVAETVGLVDNLKRIYVAARERGIRIFIVPHHRWSSQDALDWKLLNPDQIGSRAIEIFAPGSWGGEWHPDFAPQEGDVVIKEHTAQNGFTNTDLDLQLRQHGIERVICVGLIANTCIEATARYAMELGYHVTLVRDATAAFSLDRMRAAHDLNGPTYAHAILTTEELIDSMNEPGSSNFPNDPKGSSEPKSHFGEKT